MERNLYQRVFEKTYGPALTMNHCLRAGDAIRVREAVQSLRKSYLLQDGREACASRYHTAENRKAYMLAYYPCYVEPAFQIVRHYVIPALQERQAFYPSLNMAFFAGGPCPELYGTLKALKGVRLYDKANITILDWESGWQPQQQISWQLCKEDGLVHCGDEGRFIYRCNNLVPCARCAHGGVCHQRIHEQADIYFLQNYLSHVGGHEKDAFLAKMHAALENAKPGAIFVILDLQYASSKTIMRELAARVQGNRDRTVSVIGTNLCRGGAPVWSRCPYEMPAEVQAQIFRGDDGFVPKKWTKYYYLVLQKA